jgi:hypothetical protein
MSTYLEILEKIQAQALENLKQIEAVQIATLHTAREIAASLPSLLNLPNIPTTEGVPTLEQIAELNTSFATKLLDQQKAYASQLAALAGNPTVRRGGKKPDNATTSESPRDARSTQG